MKKKIILGISLFLFVLLTGLKTTEAKTLKGNVFTSDRNYYINLFYEFNSGTPFATFLAKHGTDILSYLKGICKENESGISICSQYHDSLSIITAYDVPDTLKDDLSFKKIANKTKYVFQLYQINKSISVFTNHIQVNKSCNTVPETFIAYDEEMNLLGVFGVQSNYSCEFDINFSDEDIGEIFSKLYYSKIKFGININEGAYDKIILSTVNSEFDFYQYTGFSGFWHALGNFFTGKGIIFDAGTGAFDFYKSSPVLTSSEFRFFPDVALGGGMQEPEGFSQVDISSYKYGVYLIPRQEAKDFRLYFYLTDNWDALYSTEFSLNSGNMNMGDSVSFTAKDVYKLSYIDIKSAYGLESLHGNMFLFGSNTAKDVILYYNPNAWTIIKVSDSKSGASFNYDGSNYEILPTDLIYNRETSSAANSATIGNGSHGSSGSSGNTGSSGSNGNFEFGADTVTNGFKNFVSSINGISNSIATFLSGLPPDLTALLFSGFSMGIVAMIIKIIL